MSIPLLIYYVLAIIMSAAVESASLGNGISDPLVSSAELLDGDTILSIFRRDIPPEEIINTGKYEGYIFNQNRCIQFNNRILCGYDKNKGFKLDDYTMIDIGSGCRARGDRLECGYDNPPRININLRLPDFKNIKHEEHAKHDVSHVKHDVPHGKHDVPHGKHDVPHVEQGVPHHNHHHHRHGDKHHNDLSRQAPTRTAMPTEPTVPSTILESVESDYLENTLLKSAFDKLVLKGEDTIIKTVVLTTASTKPITLTTEAVKPVTTTIIKPAQRESTLKSKISKSSETTKMTSTSEITKTLAANSEPNNASDGQMIKGIVNAAQLKKQKSRRLIERLPKLDSDLSKLISTDISKSDTTTVTPISKPCKKRNEEAQTTCVEQGDRIVCYDYSKS